MTLDERLATLDPPAGTLRYGLWRTALVAFTIGVVATSYYPMSALTAARSVDLMTRLDHWIPFVPWTWWIYFPHYVFGLVVAAVSIRSPALVWRVIAAVLVSQLVSSACYFVLPSTFPRPTSVGPADPWTRAALAWFWGTDPANNTFPSTHVSNATIAAIGAWRSRQPIRWYVGLMALGVFVTVHTTKQHYWVDAVAGLALAFLVFHLVLKLWPLPEEPLG